MEYTKYVSTRTVLFQELGSYNVALYLPARQFTARCKNLQPEKKNILLSAVKYLQAVHVEYCTMEAEHTVQCTSYL